MLAVLLALEGRPKHLEHLEHLEHLIMTHGYDHVPYPSICHPLTNPDWLRVLGVLFGLEPAPAPAERARILELGCASGGNLLPMAEHLPASRFVGIDRSNTQIDTARADALALGLPPQAVADGTMIPYRCRCR